MKSGKFNSKFPIGTKVFYHPVIGEDEYVESETRSEAWELGHGEAVVKIKGRTGGVSLEAIEVVCPECGMEYNPSWIHGCD